MPFDMPAAGASFEARGGWVVCALAADLGLTHEQAAGVVGNLGYESGGFAKLQEIKPIAGRGGYGWAQWTGPRRQAFEHWCADHDLDPSSDEANYHYLLVELTGAYAHTIEQLKKTTTLEAAVFTFGEFFERPAGTTSTHLPGDADRLKWAKRALAGATQPHPQETNTVATMPSAPAAAVHVGMSVASAIGPAQAATGLFSDVLGHFAGAVPAQDQQYLVVLVTCAVGYVIHRFTKRFVG